MTEKAGIDDAAQSVVINDILQNRSVETAKWWLRVKCADEFNPPAQSEILIGGKKDADAIQVKFVDYRLGLDGTANTEE